MRLRSARRSHAFGEITSRNRKRSAVWRFDSKAERVCCDRSGLGRAMRVSVGRRLVAR